MSIATLKLDESTTLDFGVSITGADGKPEARFVIDGKDFSVSFPAKQTNEGVEVEIKGLQHIFTAGEYSARLEIVLENKIYTPLVDKIEFVPSVHISTNSKVVVPVKESVKVGAVTVKKQPIDEDLLRKSQAATIIANALGFQPDKNLTPREIINAALSQNITLTNEQIETIREMLTLAEECGIEYNRDLAPEVVEEIVTVVPKSKEDSEWSEEDLDALASGINDMEDVVDAYEPGELRLVDDETGEVVDDFADELREDVLNEILSRVERIKAKTRFHKTQSKRERRLKVALTKHSSNAKINQRARHLAIKTMKEKLAKKPLDQLNVSEKERIERIIKSRKRVVDRLALKLTQRVRNIEKNRLAHHSTQAA